MILRFFLSGMFFFPFFRGWYHHRFITVFCMKYNAIILVHFILMVPFFILRIVLGPNADLFITNQILGYFRVDDPTMDFQEFVTVVRIRQTDVVAEHKSVLPQFCLLEDRVDLFAPFRGEALHFVGFLLFPCHLQQSYLIIHLNVR